MSWSLGRAEGPGAFGSCRQSRRMRGSPWPEVPSHRDESCRARAWSAPGVPAAPIRAERQSREHSCRSAGDLARLHEAALVGEDHGLYAVAYAELHQYVRDVRLGRGLAHHEVGGDLGIRAAAREQLQDLELALGQLGQAWRIDLVARRAAGGLLHPPA